MPFGPLTVIVMGVDMVGLKAEATGEAGRRASAFIEQESELCGSAFSSPSMPVVASADEILS